MATDNRTPEFFSFCQSLPPAPPSSNGSTSKFQQGTTTDTATATGRYSNTSNDPNDELRTFHKTASALSREIYSTSTLLNELTTLIHSRSGSLFVDETTKVNNLVLRIKSSIESLNAKLDGANDLIQRNKRRLGRNSQAGQEASNLVGQLQEEFVTTTKGFKDVLQVRSDRIKEKTDRRSDLLGSEGIGAEEGASLLGNKPKVYSGFSNSLAEKDGVGIGSRPNAFLGSAGGGNNFMEGPTLDLTSAMLTKGGTSSMPGGETSSQLPRPYGIEDTGIRLRNSNNIDSNVPTYSGSVSSISHQDNRSVSTDLPVYSPLDIQRMEEQSGQAQMMQLIPDQNYLRERADAMTAVESNIVELGTIFNKLAVMVGEHSEMVQRVEDNVDNASDNITLSLTQLTDTLTNLRTNRALFFKVFGIVVVFIIFFITFFA